jgi:hypothetical protein
MRPSSPMLLARPRPTSPSVAEWLAERPSRALLLSGAVIVLASLPIFLRPLINDDTTYALIGAKLRSGHLLYREAVDNKPPLMYATFAAAFALAGAGGLVAIKILSILVNVACAGLVLAIGRRLFDRRVGALGALLFACAATSGVAEDSVAPNTEMFMNLFALGAFWLLLRPPARLSPAILVAAGLGAAVAALFRVQGLGIVAGLAFVLLAKLGPSRRLASAAAWLGAGFLAPLAALALHLHARGTLDDFGQWVFANNFAAVQVGSAEGLTFSKAGRVLLAVASALPLVLALAVAASRWRRTARADRQRLRWLVVPFAIALVTYQLGNRLYGHYLIQAWPYACLLAAWGLVSLGDRRWSRLVPGLGLVWVAGFAAYNFVHLGRRAEPALAAATDYVRAHTRPGDQLFLWGGSPEIALGSGRDFATRFVFNNYLTGRVFGTSHVRAVATRQTNRDFENPVAWSQLWRDLEAAPPAVVIDGGQGAFGLDSYPELATHVARHYGPAVRFGLNRVYLRLPAPGAQADEAVAR